jgi:FkbM family methyltransferase
VNLALRLASLGARWLPDSVKSGLYRNRRLAGWIRRRLNQAAPVGLTVVEVAGGDLAGTRLSLDLQSEKDLWLGTYEPQLQAALRHFVVEGGTAFDVGANIGYITLLLLHALGPQGKVVAFEPLPANIWRLRDNIGLAGATDRVKLIEAAVAETTGLRHFMVHSSGGMGKLEGSSGRDEAYQQKIEVRTVTLDDIVFGRSNPIPSLVKIDIEGGEGAALRGARRLLAQGRPMLLLELHGPRAAEECWQILRGAGYSLRAMRPGYPELEAISAFDWRAYVVAVPIDPPVRT